MRILYCIYGLFLLCGSALSATGDPDELLSRVRSKMADNLAKLPNYTCRQTIDRMVRRGGPAQPFRPLDSTRIDVAFLDGSELYARPGKEEFKETDIRNMVPPGTIGNGNFATHAKIIFASDAATFTYAGETNKNGRHLVRFDFRIPLEKSPFVVRNGERKGRVAYGGSFWADVETLDLVRLDVQVTEIPPELRLTNIHNSIQYRRTRIGANDFLLPFKAELETRDVDGNAGHNYMKFDHCQEFVGSSRVQFGAVVPAD